MVKKRSQKAATRTRITKRRGPAKSTAKKSASKKKTGKQTTTKKKITKKPVSKKKTAKKKITKKPVSKKKTAKKSTAPQRKLRLAFYWAASCGGCEIAILEIAEKILDVIQVADIVFWPCIADFKYHHVIGYEDGYIDVCFFNGSIRSDENREIAELLRRKSKTLIAYGSCAHEGCIPALANLSSREGLFERCYLDNPSTPNPERLVPKTHTTVEGHELTLPELWDTVVPLADVVPVDYFVPGCPPTEKMTWAGIEAIVNNELPPQGSLLGAGNKAVCDECRYERRDTPITKIERPHLFQAPAGDNQCLLELGLICLGPATRSGCEARCLAAQQPCRGCYGPAGDVSDQGAKMIGALGSLIAGDTDVEVRQVVDQIADPAGTFYRFGLARSILRRKRLNPEPEA